MALKLYDKLKPAGGFALVNAEDVEMPDGKRLDESMEDAGQLLDENTGQRLRLWYGTQEEYDALEVHDPDVLYNIYEDVAPS